MNLDVGKVCLVDVGRASVEIEGTETFVPILVESPGKPADATEEIDETEVCVGPLLLNRSRREMSAKRRNSSPRLASAPEIERGTVTVPRGLDEGYPVTRWAQGDQDAHDRAVLAHVPR